MKSLVLMALFVVITGMASAQVTLRLGEYDTLKSEKNLFAAKIKQMKEDSLQLDKKI